jgi:hypothetical protein
VAEIKAGWEVAAVNCWKLLSDLKSRYGSYYTAQFACLLACFSDAESTVYVSVELRKILYFHRPNGQEISR